ncbi:MAG: M48 family metalloprotease, partial [Planctomycetota bacterium]
SPNAYAMGRPDSATITVTDGLLACLGRRQLAGVLAHEISHLAAGDLRIMGIASAVARLTASMASVGLFLLLVNLPLLALQGTGIPWLAILLLLLAPGASLLLQLALARRREFDADRGAAELTGDPLGLAAALQELELAARRSRIWERFFRLGGARSREIPGMLRSHPATMERRKRLLELYGARLATGPAATRRASVPLSTALCTRRRRRVSRLPRELDRMLYRMSRMPVPFPVRGSIVAR